VGKRRGEKERERERGKGRRDECNFFVLSFIYLERFRERENGDTHVVDERRDRFVS
jgi:hypothetical protein